MEEKDRLIRKLEQDLDEYDKIFLVWDHGTKSDGISSGAGIEDRIRLQELVDALCSPEMIGYMEKKWLVLSSMEKFGMSETDSAAYCRISEEAARFFYQLYQLYEFSDRFSVISLESRYGSLFNLLNTGIISIKEAAEALLH